MLLKASLEDNFGHELQQMQSFFSSDLNKFNTQNPTENFESYHIVDEKQAGIKDDIRIISSLSGVKPCFFSAFFFLFFFFSSYENLKIGGVY